MKPFHVNGQLNPLPKFHGREQKHKLDRGLEIGRELMTIVSSPNCNPYHARAKFEDLMRMCQSGYARLGEMHVRDIGITSYLAADLEAAGVLTLNDIANLPAGKVPKGMDTLQMLRVTLGALKRVLELDRERVGA